MHINKLFALGLVEAPIRPWLYCRMHGTLYDNVYETCSNLQSFLERKEALSWIIYWKPLSNTKIRVEWASLDETAFHQDVLTCQSWVPFCLLSHAQFWLNEISHFLRGEGRFSQAVFWNPEEKDWVTWFIFIKNEQIVWWVYRRTSLILDLCVYFMLINLKRKIYIYWIYLAPPHSCLLFLTFQSLLQSNSKYPINIILSWDLTLVISLPKNHKFISVLWMV